MPGKSTPRRKPGNAQTDYARWAHAKLDREAFERASRPKS